MAAQETNVPIAGNRISDTVVTEITQQQLETLNSNVSTIENVESVTVNLAVQTVRITIDANDELDTAALRTLADSIYNSVIETLPVETYFTREDNTKQYDLEITVYDSLDKEDTVIVQLVKNAGSEERYIQVLSSAANQTLADQAIANQEANDAAEAEVQANENQESSESENTETENAG